MRDVHMHEGGAPYLLRVCAVGRGECVDCQSRGVCVLRFLSVSVRVCLYVSSRGIGCGVCVVLCDTVGRGTCVVVCCFHMVLVAVRAWFCVVGAWCW